MSNKKYRVIIKSNVDNLEAYLNEHKEYEVFDAAIYQDSNFITILKLNDKVAPGDYKVLVNVDPANLEEALAQYSDEYTLVDTDLTNRSKVTAILQRGERGGGGGGGTSGMFVGYVTNGDSFPTTRLDGETPVENLDYVVPDESSVFPFAIDDVVFESRFDSAFYLEGKWYYQKGLVPKTNEVPVSNVAAESVNGSDSLAATQADLNIENVAEFAKKRRTDPAQNEWWGKKYTIPNTYVKSMDGALVTSYTSFVNKIKDIMEDTDSKPEDKFVPYTPAMCCLVTRIDLTNRDRTMECICYSNGQRIVVSQYNDGGVDRYRVQEFALYAHKEYRHSQTAKADVWTIKHNLDRTPNIYIYDEDGDITYPEDIEFVDSDTVKLTFSEPIKGYALLN